MDEESLKYWVALKAVEEVGCVGFRTLLAAFSSPRAVFAAPIPMIQAVPGIGPTTAANIRSFSDWKWAEDEVLRTARLGASIVTCEDPLYPRNLLNTYDYPPFLYVKGSLAPAEIAVALVGSRLASTYGRYVTETFSRDLALRGITIVSGMARGIDAAAHRGALAGKGRTIAVLGSGLDVVYPPEHRELADEIAAHGALLTEFSVGTPPNAPNFPSRNRIISGISLGVVVVEAGEKSGSLITARIAGEQGRSVFAVPGAIASAGSRGTHQLIKQGAKLIENVEDILEEVLPQSGAPPATSEAVAHPTAPITASHERPPEATATPPPVASLGDFEKELLRLIPPVPVDVDHLIAASGHSAQEVLNGLLILELSGLIRQLPGKLFQRKEPTA